MRTPRISRFSAGGGHMNIFRRGFSDTITHITTLVGAAFTGGASLIALYLWKGRDMTIEEVPSVAVGILGAVSGVFLILLWNIWLSPYRIVRDQRDLLQAEVTSLRSKSSIREKKQDELISRRVDAAAFLDQTVFPPYILKARYINEKMAIEKEFNSYLSSFRGNQSFLQTSSALLKTMENMWLLYKATESNISQGKRANIASNLSQSYRFYVEICRRWLLGEINDDELAKISNERAVGDAMMQYQMLHTATLRSDGKSYDINVNVTHSPDPDPFHDF